MKTLDSLQIGRGIAALAVVFHHATLSAQYFSEDVPKPMSAIFEMGYLGVDFFFVLSGFIIYYSSHGKILTAKKFIQNRFIRIFAPYLPIGIGLGFAYTFLPGLSASDREWGWLATLTLIPSSSPPALSIAWTLQHELIFYVLFGLFVAFGKIGFGMAAWAACIALVAAMGVGLPKPLEFLLAPINLEFGMGVLAAAILLSGRRVPLLWLISVAPITVFFVMGAERGLSPLFGAGLAMLILWVAQLDYSDRCPTPALPVFIGAASYSIYLVHNPLLSITSRILGGWQAALFGGIAISVVMGCAYHVVVEKPAQRLLRRQKKVI